MRNPRGTTGYNPKHPRHIRKCLNAFHTVQPLKAHIVVSPWYWAEVHSQRAKRGRKGEDTVYLFSEWGVLEVRTGFHTETMALVHPAALSLLLSLPILRLSICLWAETHGISCSPAKSSLPAPQLVSFTLALFPGRLLTYLHTLR